MPFCIRHMVQRHTHFNGRWRGMEGLPDKGNHKHQSTIMLFLSEVAVTRDASIIDSHGQPLKVV